LDKLDSSILPDTHSDIVGEWNAFLSLTSVMQSEMAQRVLVCIFSDKGVLEALAVAKLMEGVEGEVPSGYLKILKSKLTGHMKERFYLYQKELKSEIANIERVKTLQGYAIQALGTMLGAVMIGMANLASNYIYDKYSATYY
jgi:hypothetical protein